MGFPLYHGDKFEFPSFNAFTNLFCLQLYSPYLNFSTFPRKVDYISKEKNILDAISISVLVTQSGSYLGKILQLST